LIETMARVIHPGWLTVTLENELKPDDWTVYHKCVECGFVLMGGAFKNNALYEHSSQKHKSTIFPLELYVFRSNLHALDVWHGLEGLQWPDRNWNGIRK
jgi:hypothetical protein